MHVWLYVMSQKLICDKAITILQIATNYTTLLTRDSAGVSNCWFSRFQVYQKQWKSGRVCKNYDFSILIAKIWRPEFCSPRVPKRPRDICLLWSFTAESKRLRSCRTSQYTRQPKKIKRIFFNGRFQDRSIWLKYFSMHWNSSCVTLLSPRSKVVVFV